ncbi:hypothetical protein RHS03_06943, partial [Rhizoctonia solani]
MDFRLFVREVCKFPNSHYQAIEEGLDRNAFESAGRWGPIMDRIKDVPLGNEAALYAPLIDLFDSISTQIGPLFDLQSKTNLAFRDTSQKYLLDSPAFRKPDITGVSGTMPNGTPSWKDVLVCWEVKHSNKRGAQDQLGEPPRKRPSQSASRSRQSNSEVAGSTPGRDSDDPLEQLLSYCLETISAQPHRRHTIGVLLSEWRLQLVFHSRSFIVVSRAFDIRSDPVKLTVAFAALWTTDLKALGFDSHFIDNSGNVTIRPQECLVMIGDQEYTIDKVLFRARSLLGRGTGTLRAVGKSQVKVVIKFNCPPKVRESEAELLEKAQDIPNIIKVAASATWGDTLDGFGPEFVAMVNHFELREFRVLVLSPVCSPLTSIADLETFKRSFRKLVIAHHELYKTGILHCDISVGNMMYDPLGDEPYLIDVDLGKSVEKLASPSPNHRTGTLPFMATDLLVECPPPHLYRHDLESFYYVLIWICAKDHCGWDTVHSIAAMREKKDSFLAVGTSDRIGGLSLIDWSEPLRRTWINRIHGLFVRGRAAVDPYLGNVESDKETLDGYITFVKVMDVLTA